MIKQIKNNIWKLYFKEFGSCVYLLKLGGQTIVIDTGSQFNTEELKSDLNELKINPEDIKTVLLTHNHWDHVGNLNLFPNAKIYSYENFNEIPLQDFKVIETPGHTEDSICFLYQDILFSGDTIFDDGYIGRTDLPGGSMKEMEKSLKKLKKVDYKILAPGHLV